jgi:hypothetical protein
MKLLPQTGKSVTPASNEQMPTQPAAGETDVCCPSEGSSPQMQGQNPPNKTTKTDALSTLLTADTTINQQLQLIFAKLDKKIQAKSKLSQRNLKTRSGQRPTNYGFEF